MASVFADQDVGEVGILHQSGCGLQVWFRRHPGFEAVRLIFTEFVVSILAPPAPRVRVPDELLEMRNVLATRWEV